MITRSPLRPHVCLQCQRNLSKRFATSKLQSASFQSPSNSNAEAQSSQPSERPQLKIHRVPAQDRRRPSINIRKGRQKDLELRTKLGDEPAAARLHGHRGRKLQEKVEDLNTNSLGDTAKVIVLQDSKYNFYTHLNRMKDQAAKHVDIESLLIKEKGVVGVQEVNKSIDELRRGQSPQTWEELNEFVRILSEGFTYSQLLRYLEFAYSRAAEAEAEALEETPDPKLESILPSPHILHVTSWMPAVSELSDHFDEDPLRGYYMPSHTSKQKLALKVVRECWQWELPEISEGLGQFEVQMSRSDLDLLSKGSDSPLTLLHGEYLAHEDEAMEVFPSRGTIRVTTMRHKMDIVISILARDLDSIQREPIPLGALFPKIAKGRDFMAWQDQTFNDEALQELSQITSTEISRISKSTLLVSCFVDSDKPGLASRIDTVKRLLTTVSEVADQAKHTLECNTSTDGMFIRYPRIEGLGWRDKMRDWVRWTGPVSKSDSTTTTIGEVGRQEEKIEDKVDNIEESQEPNLPPIDTNTASWWNGFNETSALFGSILHTSLTPGRDLISPFDTSVSVRRGFSSLVPNLSRSLQKATFFDATHKLLPTKTPLKYITLRFLPDPFQLPWDGTRTQDTIDGHTIKPVLGTQVIKHLPHVEMRFSVSEDNSIKLKDVLAILSESKSDVMLPSNGVDIRFQDRTTRRLKHARNMESLRDFVTKSILDLRKGRMLTPPTISLPIDPQILSTEDRRVLNFGEDTRPVQYMFAGLDIRSTLVFNWKEWRILYTSIEAGQAGGRRGELKLRPIKGGEVKSKEDFIAATNELAHELGDSTAETQLVFGTPVLVPGRWKSFSTETPKSGRRRHRWGVDEYGRRGGDWNNNPALFNDDSAKTWFVNQSWSDESWDQDEGEILPISDEHGQEDGSKGQDDGQGRL